MHAPQSPRWVQGVLFGTDANWIGPRTQLGRVLDAELTLQGKRLILGDSACRLYGLGGKQGTACTSHCPGEVALHVRTGGHSPLLGETLGLGAPLSIADGAVVSPLDAEQVLPLGVAWAVSVEGVHHG